MLNTYALRFNRYGLLSSTKNIHQLCRFVTSWKHQTCSFLCTKLKKEILVSWDQGTAKKKDPHQWILEMENQLLRTRKMTANTAKLQKKKFTVKFIAFTLNCQWIDECHLLMTNRHFKLAHFDFPIQTTWCSQGNLPLSFHEFCICTCIHVAWISSDCFESFSPLSNVWIDRPVMPSSDVVTTRKPGSDFDWLSKHSHNYV